MIEQRQIARLFQEINVLLVRDFESDPAGIVADGNLVFGQPNLAERTSSEKSVQPVFVKTRVFRQIFYHIITPPSKVELYAKDSRMAILRDGTRLPVSRAGYARLSQLL